MTAGCLCPIHRVPMASASIESNCREFKLLACSCLYRMTAVLKIRILPSQMRLHYTISSPLQYHNTTQYFLASPDCSLANYTMEQLREKFFCSHVLMTALPLLNSVILLFKMSFNFGGDFLKRVCHRCSSVCTYFLQQAGFHQYV